MGKLISQILTRRKGNIENIIYSLICITTCFVIITMGINYIGAAKEYLDANQIARKYVLKMETAGYLSSAVSIELLQEMHNKGFSNISVAGSTTSRGNFGDDVILQITYMQKIKIINISGFNFTGATMDKPVKITRSSTTKG